MSRRPVLCLFTLLLAALTAAAQPGGTGDRNGGWENSWDDDPWSEPAKEGLQWTGFAEGAGGIRFDRDDTLGRRTTLADTRLRLETDWAPAGFRISLKGDVVYDGFEENLSGDFRELTLTGSPLASLDLKAGRQVLTWGIGDLLFLNDLFPKDWVSFFAGRDDEYLKASSNSVRLTQYNGFLNIDFAWTPVFAPDNYIRGERFSFFSASTGAVIAPEPPFGAKRPGRSFSNGEFAVRLFRTIRGIEFALYGYRGFFKRPADFRDPVLPRFAPLTSVGASIRRPLWSGLWNAEAAYYFSRDNASGRNPDLPNDQLRLLTGFEREWVTNFTIGLQYYLEWIQDYEMLIENSPTPRFEPDEFRHLVTARLTYRARQDTVTWSLFSFWSPSDNDYYIRPVVNFRFSDAWNFAAGLNLFGGNSQYTFFGQFDDASNAYLRARFNF